MKNRGKIKSRAGRSRVSDKISVLRREGVPQDQAIAESMSMERAGRLRAGGKYIRTGKGRKRSRKRSRSR